MTRRRSQLEINIEVLGIINNGTKKPTRIMYAANISWQTMQRVMSSLISQGLIGEIKSSHQNKRTKKHYVITQKGVKVLKQLTRIEQARDGIRHL